MSGKSNITSFIISLFIVVLTIFILLPYLNIAEVNKKLNDYQWIIALFSAVAISLTGLFSYQNWTFKKEQKSSIEIQKEGLDMYTKISNHLIDRDEQVNKNSADIRTLKSDVEDLKKIKRPARRNKNA